MGRMNAPVRQAVVLAAGMGTRLSRTSGHSRPKGFLEIGHQTLIEQSLRRLRKAGIENVLIVTGHMQRWYESLSELSNGYVRTVHNPLYDRSGSMYSLYCARQLLHEDFLLLESDLLYEQRALDRLQSCGQRDCVLLSGLSNSHDEVFVETEGGRLVAMSKDRSTLASVSGEFVGICRVSAALFAHMLDEAQRRFQGGLDVDYETGCLAAVAATYPVPVHTVFDLAWAEIDDLRHLDRARARIYPEILRRDGVERSQAGDRQAVSSGRP